MIVSVVIIVLSTLMFAYWFRYTCILILSTKTSTDYSGRVAESNHLGFAAVQNRLNSSSGDDLNILKNSLDRDYRLVSCLLRQAASVDVNGVSLEQAMLRLDFWMMRTWFSVSHRFSEKAAKNALAEMSQIVHHFANNFGEHLVRQGNA